MNIVSTRGLVALFLVVLGCGSLEDGMEQSRGAIAELGAIVVPGSAEEESIAPPETSVTAAAAVERFFWQQKPGLGTDVAISGGRWNSLYATAEWIIGRNTYNGGLRLYRWNQGAFAWDPSNGGAERGIAVQMGSLTPWVVNRHGEIWYLAQPTGNGSTGTWYRYPHLACARDIGASQSAVWALDCTVTGTTGTNYRIWQLTSTRAILDNAGGGAARIAVCDVPWIVSAAGIVYSKSTGTASSGTWQRRSTSKRARDISCGGGTPWITGWTHIQGGYPIEYLKGTTWTRVSGAATKIGANSFDYPWVINESYQIFQGLGFE
jgi:hypothetical protein